MSAVSNSALRLAGFLMAHAFWIVSELEQGDMYVPQALCESEAGRELFVFEAETQLEAVEDGKAFLAENSERFERCAFARDGLMEGVDVLVLDIVEGPLPPKLTVIQPYAANEGAFQLLGSEIFMTASGRFSDTREAAKTLHLGATEHQGALSTWQSIDRERTESGPFDGS